MLFSPHLSSVCYRLNGCEVNENIGSKCSKCYLNKFCLLFTENVYIHTHSGLSAAWGPIFVMEQIFPCWPLMKPAHKVYLLCLFSVLGTLVSFPLTFVEEVHLFWSSLNVNILKVSGERQRSHKVSIQPQWKRSTEWWLCPSWGRFGIFSAVFKRRKHIQRATLVKHFHSCGVTQILRCQAHRSHWWKRVWRPTGLTEQLDCSLCQRTAPKSSFLLLVACFQTKNTKMFVCQDSWRCIQIQRVHLLASSRLRQF